MNYLALRNRAIKVLLWAASKLPIAEPATLRQKQSLFAWLSLLLELKMWAEGYETTVGSAKRPMNSDFGHPRSTHKFQLAKDINLFLDGVYLRETADHERFGLWWEQQHPLCRWGGRFGDGNHYSLEHNGVR